MQATDTIGKVGIISKPGVQQAFTLVPKILEVSTITGFEVYGDPGPKAGEMLAAVGAEIFEHWHGISR